MAVTVAFTYNGSNTVVATLTGVTNGNSYCMAVEDGNTYPTVSGTASGTSMTLTVSTAAPSAGYIFDVFVATGTNPYLTAKDFLGATNFQQGSTSEYSFPAVWSYDGVKTITVTGAFPNGIGMFLQLQDSVNGGSSTSFTGTGASQLVSVTTTSTPGGAYFLGQVFAGSGGGFQTYTTRLFTSAVANAGVAGNPGGPTPVTHSGHGVCVAFLDGSSVPTDALATSPLWVSIDDPDAIDVVTGWQVRRGRTYMTDRTEAGTAQADFIDTAGIMDPTNSTGPFYPMDPNTPFKIELFHPIDKTWNVIYTGLVQNMPQSLDLSEKFIRGQLNAADLFSLLAIDEIPPGLDFSAQTPGSYTASSAANTVGETTYEAQNVDDRMRAILADAGIPSARTDIFTGNVAVQYTIYPPGYSTLAALQDAADAEFPGVSNLYCDKNNNVVFHGRKARSDPTGTASGSDWIFTEWNVGDKAALAIHPTYALISGLEFDRDVAKIINAASVSPDGILDADKPGQLSTNSGSITQYGNRVYTAENLLTQGGLTDGLDANQETKLMSDYFPANFGDAQNRISQITFQGVPVGAPYAEATWDILCGVDIGDQVNVTTTHPGGGGFSAAPYFVEGISYNATNTGGDNFLNVTMTLDLSPAAYFTTAPFS